jgi:quinol-cytochrome oxidoreductase complex cytochrome b subunit
MNSITKQIVGLGLFAGLLLLLNTLYYKFADQSVSTEAFEYPLAVVYSLFFILSSIVMVILHLVNKKNKETAWIYLFISHRGKDGNMLFICPSHHCKRRGCGGRKS